MYDSLRKVYRDVCSCERCGYAKTRKNTVFGEGSLHSPIMLIGEGPGAVEDETGRPFVGPAGKLLDKMLEAIDLDRSRVYICNVVKCRPPHNRDPEQKCVDQCIGYLREQVRFIRPKVIVCLGRIAANHILHEKQGITRIHGEIYERKNFIIIPTFHPSALLRNEELKKPAWEDMKTIRQVLKNETNIYET